MDRLAQWLLPILLVIEATLIPGGRLDVNATVDVPAVINSLACLVIGRQLYLVWRRYQRARTDGQDASGALVEALKLLVPRRRLASDREPQSRQKSAPQPPTPSGKTVPLNVPQS